MSKLLLVFFALFFSQAKATDERMISKGYEYNEKFDAYYKYVDGEFSLVMANLFCTEEGSRLFFPETQEEENFIFEDYQRFFNFSIWIGIGYSPMDNWTKLHNVQGEKIVQKDIKDLQEVIKGYSERIGIVMNSPNKYELHDLSMNFRFICKKQGKAPQLSGDQLEDLLSNGYVYKKEFNSLYKYKKVQWSYPWELLWCNMDGGTTFLPQSREESHIPRDLNITGFTYIGASKIFNPDFVTVEGENFSETFADWIGNQAKFDMGKTVYLPKYKFLAVNSLGKFYVTSENNIKTFICKIQLPAIEPIHAPIIQEDLPQNSTFFNTLKATIADRFELSDQFIIRGYQHLKGFNAFYKFYGDRPYSLLKAALICSSDGASLFLSKSNEESEKMYMLVPDDVDTLWIGIVGTSSGRYYTLEGQQTNMNAPLSKILPLKHGIALYRNLTIKSVDYTEEYKFVCKWTMGKWTNYNKGTTKMNLMIDGYNFYTSLNSWYKYYDVAETFEYALVQCLVDGATLFVPKSDEELQEIMDNMEINDHIWLGITKFLRNYFVTAEGMLAHSYFHNWDKNQPDLKYDFVALNENGTYFTADNSNKYNFICKINLK